MIATLTHGSVGIVENLTAIIVVETILLAPTLLVRSVTHELKNAVLSPTGGKLHESEDYVEVESVKKTTEVYLEILKPAVGASHLLWCPVLGTMLTMVQQVEHFLDGNNPDSPKVFQVQ